jgi:hemolysin activation/secretion protein
MISRCSIFRIMIMTTIAISLSAAQAGAENTPPPSSINEATRAVDQPFRQEAEKKLKAPPKKLPPIQEEKPKEKGPEGPKFLLKKVILQGVESIPEKDLGSMIAKYENREVTLSDLNTLADEIKAEYLKRGFIVACFVPPQDVKDGVVTLQVVEARMGDLKVTGGKRYDREIVAFYWALKRAEILRYDKMSRSLYEMNKNPDRTVKATLAAGKEPKTTDVIMDVESRRPVHIFSSIDREGTVSTGRERYGAGFRHNNFLFCDDSLIAGYTFSEHSSGIYGYHSIPITDFGTSVMYGYSYSKAQPKKEFASLGLNSIASNASCYVHQDIFKKADYFGEVYGGMDASDKTTWMDIGTTNRDVLRIVRIGSNLMYQSSGTALYITPELSQGVNGFGARRKNYLSSRGADSAFTKFRFDATSRTSLPYDLQSVIHFKSQYAADTLTPQEEAYLGGMNSVRGYPNGDFLADDAVQASVEVLVPAFCVPDKWKLPRDNQKLKDRLTGVVFYDYAYGYKRGDLAGETKQMTLIGVGPGLRIRVFDVAVLRLEWGFPIGDAPVTESEHSRFHFSLDFKI